jgi:hypothetical protein
MTAWSGTAKYCEVSLTSRSAEARATLLQLKDAVLAFLFEQYVGSRKVSKEDLPPCTAVPLASAQRALQVWWDKECMDNAESREILCEEVLRHLANRELKKAHRKACSAKTSMQALECMDVEYPPADFAAALCFLTAHPLIKLPPKVKCMGCGHVLLSRAFQEHTPGCTELQDVNVKTTHDAVKRCLAACGRRANVEVTVEPRFGRDDKGKKKLSGPDVTLDLEKQPLTVDVKVVNTACATHAGKCERTIFENKAKAATQLYEKEVNEAGHKFMVPCVTQCGGVSREMTEVIKLLAQQDVSNISTTAEVRRIAATTLRHMGRVMLRHGRRIMR